MKNTPLSALLVALTFFSSVYAEAPQHLFIMSGQSNMKGLDPTISFQPAVEKAFGKENITIVHDALGGQPIRRWYKDWQPTQGEITDAHKPNRIGDLYDKLMNKVAKASEEKTFKTITFLWMQGERDAKELEGKVYEESFKGLIKQLQNDLNRNDLNIVIGRLSDFDLTNEKYPHWTIVREAQTNLANTAPNIEWVDTDDLNDGINKKGKSITNDLHYSVDGYKTFGERLAKKSIQLIQRTAN